VSLTKGWATVAIWIAVHKFANIGQTIDRC
jgi:hypothetical protein